MVRRETRRKMEKQSPKMSARVVNAIRNLREAHGSTSKEIMNYIMSQSSVPASTVQRQMQAALKRGLEYGILMKNNGHYFLNTESQAQFASGAAPVERGRRRRRRGRSKRRKGRRRSRGRRRRKSRRSHRRRSRGRRSRATKGRRAGCSRCGCIKRNRDVHVLRSSPVEQQRVPDAEDDVCTCEKKDGNAGERRSRQSKSRDRSLSRSRSSANSDRDDAMDDRRSIHD